MNSFLRLKNDRQFGTRMYLAVVCIAMLTFSMNKCCMVLEMNMGQSVSCAATPERHLKALNVYTQHHTMK